LILDKRESLGLYIDPKIPGSLEGPLHVNEVAWDIVDMGHPMGLLDHFTDVERPTTAVQFCACLFVALLEIVKPINGNLIALWCRFEKIKSTTCEWIADKSLIETIKILNLPHQFGPRGSLESDRTKCDLDCHNGIPYYQIPWMVDSPSKANPV
jgi:hypothetical protein